jgi:hypothetical protein
MYRANANPEEDAALTMAGVSAGAWIGISSARSPSSPMTFGDDVVLCFMSRQRQFMAHTAMLTDLAENNTWSAFQYVRQYLELVIGDWHLTDGIIAKTTLTVASDEILTYDRQNLRSRRVSA